jgi:hypothetical protein
MNKTEITDLDIPEPDEEPSAPADLVPVNRTFLQRINLSWRQEDEVFLTAVKAEAATMFHQMFADAVNEVDKFYGLLRVPVMRNGEQLTVNGRPQWEQKDGKPVERWDMLTLSDVAHIIMNLERIKLAMALDVNRLRCDAIYGKMVADDVEDDCRGDTGAQEERKARGRMASRSDRYFAFYLYYMWSLASTFEREITNFIFRLRDVKNWQMQSE